MSAELEEAVRRFAQERIGPHREALDLAPARPPPFSLRERLAEVGALDPSAVPSLPEAVRVVWALGETDAGAGAVAAFELLGRWLSRDLGVEAEAPIALCLPAIDSGAIEPGARLEAEEVTGAARGVPLAADARCFAVFCAGAIAFVRREGARVGDPVALLGVRALPVADVQLESAPASATRPVDPRAVASWFARAALLCTASACATATAALEEARLYARERYQGGRMIDGYDAIRLLLGPNDGAMRSARSAILDLAEGARDGSAEGMVRILRARSGLGRAAIDAATSALQVLGGYGYMRDYGLEKRYRDAVALALLPADGTRLALLAEEVAGASR